MLCDIANCTDDTSALTLSALKAKILEADTSDKVRALNLPIFFVEYKQDDLIFIPPAFFVLELSTNGIMSWGMRKFMFPDTAPSKKRYEFAKKLMEKDGRDVTVMSQIANLFTAT